MTAQPTGGTAPLAHRAAIAGLVLAFPLAVLSARAAGVLFWALALAGLALLAARRASLPAEPRLRRALLFAALAPVALNVASVLWHGRAASAIGWTPLLALPALIALATRVGFDARHLLWGAVLGALSAFGAAVVGRAVFGAERADITMNAILFGQGAFAFGALALLGLAWRLPFRWPWLLAGATVAGGCAFVLAGYRGGLLALPVLLLGLPWWRSARRTMAARRSAAGRLAATAGRRRRWATPLLGGALSVAALAGALAVSPLSSRLGEIQGEVTGFAQGQIQNSSVGARMAMWRASFAIVVEHPVFGVGARAFQSTIQRFRTEGRFPADVALFDHAHNTYLTVAAEYGAIGLVVMAAALVATWRLLGAGDRAVARVGRALIVCWLAFALTNDVLAHQTTVRLIVLIVAAAAAAAVARIGAPDRQPSTPGQHR